MKKLGVAIIGAGFWGKNHARVLSELSHAKLVAICDTESEQLSTLSTAYRVPYYLKLNSLLARDDVDAVTICTPTVTHYTIALEVLEANKHLLIEKPMTSTVEEAESLIREAESRDLTLSVGFIERFNPAVRYLKQLMDEGKLGKVLLTLARRVSRWPERVGDVGVIKDSAIHDIDVMRYILGDEVASVYAKTGSYQHRFEDWAEIMLQFKRGELGFIDANWLTPRKIRTLITTGSEATATIDYVTQEIAIEDSEKMIKPKVTWKEPLKLELQHFVDTTLNLTEKNKEPMTPTGKDGVEALKICEAALQSNSEGKPVTIH
jgi:UDP-N-acetylglucosamine 3-dehydrogenase